MKLEVCRYTTEHEKICDDPKYCCELMELCVKSHHFETQIYKDHVNISMPNVSMEEWEIGTTFYNNHKRDLLMMGMRLTLMYCPFCGEKVE